MTAVNKITANTRDESFDVLKGIGICLVLVAHSLGGYVHTFAYSFHMPLFFLVAGYFFKQRSYKEAFLLDFRRIMIPLFFSGALMLVLTIIFQPFHFENIKTPSYVFEALIYGNGSMVNYHKIFGNFASIGSIWFLGALFWSRQFFNLLSKLDYKLFIILIWGIGSIACLAGQYIQLPYSMIQGLTALPFLWIGYETKQRRLLNDSKIRKGGFLFIILWFVSTFYSWLDMAQVKWKLYYVPNIILATSGTFFFYIVSRYITKHFSIIKNSLAFLGRYSIILVCFPVIETYALPLDDIIPNIPMKGILMIGLKVIWCALTLLAVIKISFLRKIFSIK